MLAADPAVARRWAAEPLPLTGQLTATMAAQYAALPREARDAPVSSRISCGPPGPANRLVSLMACPRAG
jgi:hypothetical protein